MTKNKIITYSLLIGLFLLSFLVFIKPGMPDNIVGIGTKLLLLIADFGLIYYTIHGRYRVILPKFIGKYDTKIDLNYAMPKTIKAHYDDFTENNLELISQKDEVENVFYYLFETSKNAFVLQNCIHIPETDFAEEVAVGNHLLTHIFDEGQAGIYDVNEKHRDALQHIYISGKLPKSIAYSPVRYDGQVVGILGADSFQYNAFESDFTQFLKANSSIISSGLQYLEAIYQLDNKSTFLKRLANFNTVLSTVEDAEHLYKNLSKICTEIFHYDKLSVAYLPMDNPNEGKFVFVDGYADDFEMGHTFKIGEGLWSYIIINKAKLISNDYDKNLPLDYRLKVGDMEEKVFNTILGVPLIVGNKVFGAMTIESHKSLKYTKKELEVLMLIGLNFAAAFHRLDMYSTMKKVEAVDALTGAMNHRAFMERFFEEIYRAKRYEYELTFLSVTVEQFHKVQEKHGHLYGDSVLKKISEIIRETIRRVDILARIGQNEFAVLLIKCNKEAGTIVGGRIQNKVDTHSFDFHEISEKLTVNCGVGSYPEDGMECNVLMDASKETLYTAPEFIK